MKVMSLEDLQRIKEKFSKDLKLRKPKVRGKIVVGIGRHEEKDKVERILKAIWDELEKNSVNDIIVTQSSGTEFHEAEPTVKVQIEENESVVYGHVDEEQARRIVKEHIINGKILSDILVKGGKA